MRKHPILFYWKWREEAISDGVLEANLADMIRRFSFDILYVSYHHLRRAFDDPDLRERTERCRAILAVHGRKLLLDVDIRRELDGFSRRYPGVDTWVTRFVEIPLDDAGRGQRVVADIPRRRAGGARGGPDHDYVIRAWAFRQTEPGVYDPSTLVEVTSCVQMHGEDTEGRGAWNKRITVSTGEANAGKTALVFPAFQHTMPDPFSPMFYEYYTYLLSLAGTMDLAGATIDEYGYYVVIENEEGRFVVQHYPYTPYMSKDYKQLSGRPLEDDLLHLAYAPAGEEGRALRAVNDYLQTLRDVMRKNNDWFYWKTKETFGKDAFVGVHPTFWGDPTDFTVDILLNGVDWWEVRRDYAQTDEMVLVPIRLALAHKWGGQVWYNMWYSQSSLQIESYYRETWNSARFGGRTHYLGYECPNEPGILWLKGPGMLEALDSMERRLAGLDGFQRCQPDCRVVVVFGMEAATNWRLNGHTSGRLERGRGRLGDVLRFTQSLFESGYLCDLVPSTEIVNGDLRLVGDRATYGTQTYDAVIYLEPECMDRSVLVFLTRYAAGGGNLVVNGRCDWFSDGHPATQGFEAFARGLRHWYPDAMSTREAMRVLEGWRIPGNMPPLGCLYQDGSVIFTAPGVLPRGNPLSVDCVVAGHHIRFEGEDFLCLALNKEGRVERTAWGSREHLAVDGESPP